MRDAVWLLAKFISLTLEDFEDIRCITFSTPFTNVDMSKMLKGIGHYLGLAKEDIYVQDYKESFCQYMFYQPKELWQYESALFYSDEDVIRAYMPVSYTHLDVYKRQVLQRRSARWHLVTVWV